MGSVGQYTQGWFPWMGYKSTVNWNHGGNSSALLGMGDVQTASGAQNDEITWDIWLDTGTWKYAQVHWASSNVGIYGIQLDGVSQGTIDGYSAGGVQNQYSEITGISVTVASLKTFKIIMATKNVSSSAYFPILQSCAWVRTSGTSSIPAGTDTPGYTWHYLPWMGSKANTTFGTRAQDSTDLGGGYLLSDGAGAQNSEVSWDIWLDTGTYKYAQVHFQNTNRGIYSVQLDAVEKGTIDGYAGVSTNNVYTEITGITVSIAAVKSFKLKMATKNGSSSSYLGVVMSDAWIRTGA